MAQFTTNNPTVLIEFKFKTDLFYFSEIIYSERDFEMPWEWVWECLNNYINFTTVRGQGETRMKEHNNVIKW